MSFSVLTLLALPACMLFKQNNGKKPVNRDITHLDFTVAEAPEWTSLFYRKSGWLGGDGIFSIPLINSNGTADSDSILFIFSDTLVGEIEDDNFLPRIGLVNNTVAYMEGIDPQDDKIQFFINDAGDDAATSFFTPNTSLSEQKDYYWLGDGFVNHELNDNIYIFAYRMRNMDSGDDWSFRQAGNVIIKLQPNSHPPFSDQEQIETPFIIQRDSNIESEAASLGAGIFVNTRKTGAPNPDGYVYVYGVQGHDKNLIIARVLPENFEDFDHWLFLNGESWVKGIENAGHITQSVSNELSVSPLSDGRYALVFQKNGMSSTIGLRLGLTPYGPFGPIIEVWKCTEGQKKNHFTYNAKAHPALSKDGELLISYNVNAFDFFNEIKKDPHLYRPRFIKIKY